jgi:predicted transcriptional regulator of viral defense system
MNTKSKCIALACFLAGFSAVGRAQVEKDDPLSPKVDEIVRAQMSEKLPGVALAVKGIVCLLSALRFHDFTAQSPRDVWMAIGQKSWAPQNPSISIRLVRMSGQALSFGIKEYKIAGTMVHVFNPAKTVADCFKFRNKIGLDVAIEALRESRRRKKVSMDELWAAAKVCRVANVMRPYMESL